VAEKRRPRKSMKELTNPNSPSYVPCPYPKNRKEIIRNIKYYYVDLTKDAKSFFIGGVPVSKRITTDLFSPYPNYKIGKIVKVKNRSSKLPDDHTWLVYVMDAEDDAVMRIVVFASGLVYGGGAVDKNELINYPSSTRDKLKRLMKVKHETDVKKHLSESLGRHVDDHEIKKLERVGFFATIGDFQCPLWEFTMKDGTIYYYSEDRDIVYRVDKKLSWKKDKKGRRPAIRDFLSHRDYFPDTINDELVSLKPLPRKKN
jgi:hypothetical protein